jgi:hypothetical protein
VCTIPFNLNGAAVMTGNKDNDEWRKTITSILLAGKSHVLFDNISGKLTSSDLAAAITAPMWEDRVLEIRPKSVIT